MEYRGKKSLDIMKTTAKRYNQWLVTQVKNHLKSPILDAGAGNGAFVELLLKDYLVYAIDQDRELATNLQKILPKEKAGYGDIEQAIYFFNKKKFKTIMCFNVLEHIKNDDKALLNLYNLLSHRGKLIILVPAHQWAYGEMDKEINHFRRYSKDSLKNLLENNHFTIISIKYLNMFGLLGWFVAGKIFKRKMVSAGQIGIFDKIMGLITILEKRIEPPVGLSIFAVCQKK